MIRCFVGILNTTCCVFQPEDRNLPADDDPDGFRRAMAVRARRGRKFLQDNMAVFCLLLTLVLHQLLATLTKIAFRLKDDRQDMANESQRSTAKRRRRCKSRPGPGEEEDAKQFTLLDFGRKTRQVLDMLWQILFSQDEGFASTVFAVPAAFWPQGSHVSEMYKRMTRDILKTQANIALRIVYRYDPSHCGPLSLLEMSSSPEPPEELAQSKVKLLVHDAKECCLDQSWAVPVRKDVVAHEGDSQAQILTDHVRQYASHARGVSLREEGMHRHQRQMAGGDSARALEFAKQSANMVILDSFRNYADLCGDASVTAPVQLKAALKDVRDGRIIHSRPKQFGNPRCHLGRMGRTSPRAQACVEDSSPKSNCKKAPGCQVDPKSKKKKPRSLKKDGERPGALERTNALCMSPMSASTWVTLPNVMLASSGSKRLGTK